MKISISIALATYNGGKYLQALLDSLVNQLYLPYELVVSDDNSSDNTIAILEAFAKTAPFQVRIIKNTEQLGVIKNFAKAFENTSGKLIAYCDQDDIWHPEKLQKCVQHFTDPTVKLVMHRSEVVNDDLQPLGYCIPEKHEIEIGETVSPSSIDMTYGLGHQMLFDRQMYSDFTWIFNEGFGALEPIAENYDFLIPFIAGINGTIVSREETFVKFRRHETATSDAGLNDKSTEAVTGFLGKTPSDYLIQAQEFADIATSIEQHVLPKMEAYRDNLEKYTRFLKKRADAIHLRGQLYSSHSIFKRCATYLNLLSKFPYKTKSKGGFGRKALLVDGFITCCGLSGAQKIIALKSSIRG